jgi:hypothetical protein
MCTTTIGRCGADAESGQKKRIQKYLRVLVEYADVVEPEITRRMIEPPITYHWLLHV